MFAESAGVPFVSVLVVLGAGNMIASGKVTFLSAFIASILGITLGSSFSYFLGFLGIRAGKKINSLWLGKHIKKKPYHESMVFKFLDRYGNFSIFLAQLFGTTRTFISFPAGALELNILRFLGYTALGGAIFSLVALLSSIILNTVLRIFFQLVHVLVQVSPIAWLGAAGGLLFFYWAWLHYRNFSFLKKNYHHKKGEAGSFPRRRRE